VRAEAAAETRQRILDVAHELFVSHGYDAMTMQAVAERAEVALDTVYEVVGKKPLLARLLVETAISRTDRVIPAEERDYVRRIQAEPDARTKLAIYAGAVVAIHGRLAPLVHALEGAAARHPELAAMWREIAERRARNMRLFASNLVATGTTRAELTVERIADIVWGLAAPEVYLLFVEQRRWSPADFESFLREAWERLLLSAD
jgi:AcrR family transcriptional regulator